MRFQRLDQTSLADAASPDAARLVVRLGDRVRRLPSHAGGARVLHALSPCLPGRPATAAIVRRLQGRLTVINPLPVTRLPAPVRTLLRGLARHYLGPPAAPRASVPDARADDEARRVRALLAELPDARALPPGGASWCAAALYEQSAPAILHDADCLAALPPARFVCDVRYRVAMAVGTGAPPPWHELDAQATQRPAWVWAPLGAPAPWFTGRLLLPDTDVLAAMTSDAADAYTRLTGRAHGTGEDRYWFAESWERFLEPGRVVGYVTPDVVGFSHRAALGGSSLRRPRRPDDTWYDVGGAGSDLPPPVPPPVSPYTPAVERGLGVPPGYCLVDCAGSVEVAVVVAS